MPTLRRLPGGEAFDRAYREGTVINGPFFVARAFRTDAAGVRWGFAVGKRLDRRAAVRNRLRRRLREVARGIELPGGLDVVITAKAPALTATHSQLIEAMHVAAQRIARRLAAVAP